MVPVVPLFSTRH